MKNTSLILLTGGLLALVGCKKDDKVETCPGSCTVITGRLLTAGGTTPLARVPLTVKWLNRVSLFGGDVRTKATATTNADGWYTLRFFVRDDELHQGYFKVDYSVDKSKYYDLGSDFAFMELPRDTTIVQDYLIPRKAYVELVLTNPGALTAADSFWSNFSSRSGLFPGTSTAGPAVSWPLQGQSSRVEVAGDQPVVVENLRNKAGVRVVTYDTLRIPAGTTQPYTVTF